MEKKLVHKAINEEWRLEKIKETNKNGGWKCVRRVIVFFKIIKHYFKFNREMRVDDTARKC